MINEDGGYLYKLLSISYPTFILKSAKSPIRICQPQSIWVCVKILLSRII